MAGPTRLGMAAAAAFPPAAWSSGGESSGSAVKAAMQGCGARRQGVGPRRGLLRRRRRGSGQPRQRSGGGGAGDEGERCWEEEEDVGKLTAGTVWAEVGRKMGVDVRGGAWSGNNGGRPVRERFPSIRLGRSSAEVRGGYRR